MKNYEHSSGLEVIIISTGIGMESILPVFLFVTGLLAIFIEFFIPAFGIIAIVGIGSIIASTAMAFKRYSTLYGYIFLVLTVVGVPGLILIGLKNFPRTFFGRKLILWTSQKPEEGYVSSNTERFLSILGKEGITITKLRPSGIAEIGGKRISVVTEGGMIEKGKKVRVVKIEGSRVVVREKNYSL